MHKSVPPAPGLPRAGAGRPRDARFEKFLQVQNVLRIFTVAPGKYTGDHRQIMGIMGRSWAVSRVFHKLCPNCIKSLYNHQRRGGAQKRRGTFAYMATPYCDFTHFQYSFSAEGACQKFKKWRARARARARLFSRLRNFAGGLARVSLSEATRLRFCRFPKEDGRKTTGRGKPTSWSQFSKRRKEEIEKKRKRRASPSHVTKAEEQAPRVR